LLQKFFGYQDFQFLNTSELRIHFFLLTENCWFWTGNTIIPCRWEASYHVWNSQLYFARGNM